MAVKFPRTQKRDVLAKIKSLVEENSSNAYFLDHAELRMQEREISRKRVINVVRRCAVADQLKWCTENNENGWRCRIQGFTGSSKLSVVVKLVERENSEFVLVITLFEAGI